MIKDNILDIIKKYPNGGNNMRKVKTLIISFALILLVSLTSCHTLAEANLYRYWNNIGVELSDAHVYEEISYNKLAKKISKLSETPDEVIYVFYGDSSVSNAKTNIIIYNEQAIQFEVSKVYWLDSRDLKDKVYDQIEDDLGVVNSEKKGVLWSFKYQEGNDTSIYFDGSKDKFDTSKHTDITQAEISRICFTNLESKF